MERYKMVETSLILPPLYSITESNKMISEKLNNFIEKFGCFKMLVVCEFENKYRIIDGNKAFNFYKKQNVEKILCYNLGKMPSHYELGFRILLNAHFKRLDYLGIAEGINDECTNSHECITMSNLSGISITDVERYKDLLKFDWNDFLSKKIEPNQLDIFNIINE